MKVTVLMTMKRSLLIALAALLLSVAASARSNRPIYAYAFHPLLGVRVYHSMDAAKVFAPMELEIVVNSMCRNDPSCVVLVAVPIEYSRYYGI